MFYSSISTYASIHLCIAINLFPIYSSTCSSLDISLYACIWRFVFLYHPCLDKHVYLSINLSLEYPSIYLHIYIYRSLSLQISIDQSMQFIYQKRSFMYVLFIYIYLCLSINQFIIRIFIYLSSHLYLSISLSANIYRSIHAIYLPKEIIYVCFIHLYQAIDKSYAKTLH